MNEFTCSWQVLSPSDVGSVIEFTFRGVHHWAHGPQMMRYIETVLAEETAAAIVIDLHGYSYEFGNDLFGLFTVGFDKVARRIRPVCVVARGQTQVSLKSLLAASNMGRMLDVTFVSTPADLAEWLLRRRS